GVGNARRGSERRLGRLRTAARSGGAGNIARVGPHLGSKWMSIPASISGINPKNYKFLQEHVYSHSGIVLEEDKQYLFECRLAPIVRQLGLESIDDLCALIQLSRHP